MLYFCIDRWEVAAFRYEAEEIEADREAEAALKYAEGVLDDDGEWPLSVDVVVTTSRDAAAGTVYAVRRKHVVRDLIISVDAIVIPTPKDQEQAT